MVLLLGGLTNIADVTGAGYQMRDRGKYLRSGTFTFLPGGTSTSFNGVLVGYAPYANGLENQVNNVSGWYQIDGGVQHFIYGWGAVAINRFVSSYVTISNGVAWGVSYPPGGTIPSYYEMSRAVDRMHKDGSVACVTHNFQYGSPGGNLTATTNLVNQGGSGILTHLSCMIDYVPPGTTNDASLALDVYTDGAYRFGVGVTRRTLQGDGQMPGMTASVGFIPFNSNLTVGLRRAHNGTQLEVFSAATFVTGTIT